MIDTTQKTQNKRIWIDLQPIHHTAGLDNSFCMEYTDPHSRPTHKGTAVQTQLDGEVGMELAINGIQLYVFCQLGYDILKSSEYLKRRKVDQFPTTPLENNYFTKPCQGSQWLESRSINTG